MKNLYLVVSLLFLVQRVHAQNGTPQCKNRENIVCVDATNSQGWPGPDYGAWIMSAIASLPTVNGYKSGEVVLAPSLTVVTQSSGVKIASPFVSIKGPGVGALQIKCTFDGNCWDVHTNPFVIWPGGSVSGFSLIGDGTKNADAVGFHIGDIIGAKFEDLAVDNFRGANSACVWLDNRTGWTERNLFLHIDTGLAQGSQKGCTKDWRWTNSGGSDLTSSFSHNHYIADKFSILDGQTAFSVEGAGQSDSDYSFTGNVADGATATVFAISGLAYKDGPPTVFDGTIDISVECTPPCTTATLVNIPYPIAVTIRAGMGFYDSSGLMTSTITGSLVKRLNNGLNSASGPESLQIAASPGSGASGTYSIIVQQPRATRSVIWPDPGGKALMGFSLNKGSGVYQTRREVRGCMTTVSVGGVCSSPIEVKWPASFVDTNYSAGCSASGAPTNLPSAPYVVSKAVGSITVNYSAVTAAPAFWATIDCWAIHD